MEKKIDNFSQTVKQLESFLAEPIRTDRDKAGVIQAFEFTFEQSWKAIQKNLGSKGVEIGNPRKAFSEALINQLIDKEDESSWLQMIGDRNLTSHTYKQALADEILGRIRKIYLLLFKKLQKTLGSFD